MRITFGEHDDFAGFDRDRLSATDRGEAPPLGNDVIGDEILRAREDLRQDPLPRRRLDGPWRLGHDVKKRGAGLSRTVRSTSESASAAIASYTLTLGRRLILSDAVSIRRTRDHWEPQSRHLSTPHFATQGRKVLDLYVILRPNAWANVQEFGSAGPSLSPSAMHRGETER